MTPYYADDLVTIYHGDNREWLPEAGCVLTDPPYGIGAHAMTLGNGMRRLDRGERSWDVAPADLSAVLTLNVPTIIWGGNYFALPPSRCWLVWDKGTGDNDYADCELAWTNRDGVVKRYARGWVGQNARERTEARLHPTQKPVELMRWCLGFAAGIGSALLGRLRTASRTPHVTQCGSYSKLSGDRCRQYEGHGALHRTDNEAWHEADGRRV